MTGASWKWTRRFTVGLTMSVAGFSMWGALAPHIPTAATAAPMVTGVLMAALYGNSQGLANCMAANTRRAWDCGKAYRLPALFFAGCFVGFALLSMSGLHSAWEFVRTHAGGAPLPDDSLMRWLFAFVAFSEPAMNYGVEALKLMGSKREREEERQDLDAAAARETRRREADVRRSAFHAVGPATAAVAVAAVPMSDQTQSLPQEFPLPPVTRASPADVAGESHAAHGWRGPRDRRQWERFMEARELGMTPTKIIRELGLPSTTVYRWRRLLEAPGSAAMGLPVAGRERPHA